MGRDPDTIAAISTPPGRGGIGVIRVSGPQAGAIGETIAGALPPPRHAALRRFTDADRATIDSGLLLYLPGPASFTGEDSLELHGHGGPVVMDALLARVLVLGARQARPGEFSERAFLNDKIDLAQAEAIADLIDSASATAARSAQRSLSGAFSKRIDALGQNLIELRTYVEAAIDFPEEEVDFLSEGGVAERLVEVMQRLDDTRSAAREGYLLREGATVVIAGRPNVGKSSLLNRLAGRDTAIVTEHPGTTRDLLREPILVDGLPINLIDTAGLRVTGDPVEAIGVKRAQRAAQDADAILVMIDDRSHDDREVLEHLPPGPVRILAYNKIDLSHGAVGARDSTDGIAVGISARTGEGVDSLMRALKNAVGYRESEEGAFSVRRRHLDALQRARDCLECGQEQLQERGAGELLADDLRRAHEALGEITGEFSSDDLLGEIFTSFCIGK